MWSGDQTLWELKGATGSYAHQAGGTVSYFHVGGIDRPLVITKAGRPSVIPHQDWRGQFILGTYSNGQRSDCAGGQTTGCELINWPGHRTTAWHHEAKAPDIRTWYGGLVDGMRDGTGQMYMRNRYDDPATGQFTQPDPIGLAGGLNSYGFAAGDPVSYSDPYGLCAFGIGQDAAHGRCGSALGAGDANSNAGTRKLRGPERDAVRADLGNLHGIALSRIRDWFESDRIRVTGRTGHGRVAEAVYGWGILVLESFFAIASVERSWVLAHEDAHLLQWTLGRLVSEGDDVRPSRRRMLNLFGQPPGSDSYNLIQQDANAYACRYTIEQGAYARRYCQ